MNADMLPGFGAPAGSGRVTTAARETIADLKTAGLITPAHSLTIATLFTLTEALDTAAATGGKAYSLASLAAQIQSTLDALPKPPDELNDADPWQALESHIAADHRPTS